MANLYQDPPIITSFRLLIVEDEPVILQRLERLFCEVLTARQLQPDISVANSLSEAQQALDNNHYHLVSLDLNLTGDSGFELLQHASCSACQCIIISAYRDLALTAFEYGALDFIAKPFSKARLDKGLARLLDKQEMSNSNTKYLLVKNGSNLLRLLISEVESISGYGNYSQLHLQNGEQNLHEMGLESLLKILPASFLRVHKSHLLNLDQFAELKSLGGGQYQVKTLSGNLIPVGRTKVKELKKRITGS